MTREELDADIACLEEAVRFFEVAGCRCAKCACTRRSLQIRRDMLAKLDGPAPGFVRVRAAVFGDVDGRWAVCGAHDAADEDVAAGSSDIGGPVIAWITADVPLPRVVEVDGTVVE